MRQSSAHNSEGGVEDASLAAVPQADPCTELLTVVRALQLVPLQYTAWVRGKALRRHVGDVTGISQARLANTSQEFRPSTEQQAREHAKSVFRANMATAGLSPADIEVAQKRAEDLEAAGGGSWASFWTGLDYPVEPELTACTPGAVNFDKLLLALSDAASAGDLRAFCAAAAAFLSEWNLPQGIVATAGGPGLEVADWSRAANWDGAAKLAQLLLEAAFFDQFAHVDAVWGNAFFGRLQPRPVFSLIAPKRRPPRSVEMPARRLLQLSFALNFWARYLKWPAKPPSPKELGDALQLRAEDVSRLFDGTTKLYYEQFENRWSKFGSHVGLTHKMQFPAPLAVVAICWQQNLITVSPTRRLTSFIVLDSGYERLWRWRRSGIAAQSQGTEPWAAWLDD